MHFSTDRKTYRQKDKKTEKQKERSKEWTWVHNYFEVHTETLPSWVQIDLQKPIINKMQKKKKSVLLS